MRQNGLVMEVKGKKAVVLGKDGRFYKTTAQSGWETGQEITWDPNVNHKAYRVPIWQKTLAAGAAACLILGGGLWYGVQHSTLTHAYAYVSVDINPSIIYTLNHREKVIAAKGLNADGKTLLTHLHPKGEGLQKVLSETVRTAVLNHMLPKRDTILVTAAPIHSNEDISTLMSMARADMEQAVTMNPKAAKQQPGVYSLSVSAAVSQAAQKLNMSPGKLIAYLAAHESGQNVAMQQLHGEVLKNILTNAQLPSVMNTIQSDNVHQIEDWVSKAMSVKQQPAVQKQNNPDSSKNTGENVVRSSTTNPPNPSGKGQSKGHSKATHPQLPSSQSKGNGMSDAAKGTGKHLTNSLVGNRKGFAGKSKNGRGQGGHKGGSSFQNSMNQIFSLGRGGKDNQPGSGFVQNVINRIESMNGVSKQPKPSSTESNHVSTSSSFNQTYSSQSSDGDKSDSSDQPESDGHTQNGTSDSNTTFQKWDSQSGNTVNGSGTDNNNSSSSQGGS